MLNKYLRTGLTALAIGVAMPGNVAAQGNYYNLNFPGGTASPEVYPVILTDGQKAVVEKQIANGGIEEKITVTATGMFKRKIEVEYKDGICETTLTLVSRPKISSIYSKNFGAGKIHRLSPLTDGAGCNGYAFVDYSETAAAEGSTLENYLGNNNSRMGISGTYFVKSAADSVHKVLQIELGSVTK